MTGNTIIKSLLSGVASWLIVALVFHFMHGTTLAAELFSTYVMAIGGCAFAGSLIGYMIKKNR